MIDNDPRCWKCVHFKNSPEKGIGSCLNKEAYTAFTGQPATETTYFTVRKTDKCALFKTIFTDGLVKRRGRQSFLTPEERKDRMKINKARYYARYLKADQVGRAPVFSGFCAAAKLTHKEVAKIMGITRQAVQQAERRAVNKIRLKLAGIVREMREA